MTQPRLAWTSLVDLRDENDLGHAAVLELFLFHHGELTKHELRAEPNLFSSINAISKKIKLTLMY